MMGIHISKTKDSFKAAVDSIYPLTIVSDKYNGDFSGGKYTAWNASPTDIPVEIYDDEYFCKVFWESPSKSCPEYGVGDTIREAVYELWVKINNPKGMNFCDDKS